MHFADCDALYHGGRAVDWFLGQSDAGFETEFRRRADRISAQLKDIPTLKSEVAIPPLAGARPAYMF
jgi:hypothetical protein